MKSPEYIVAPRKICQLCSNTSGPKFYLSTVSIASKSEYHRNNVPIDAVERESKLSQIPAVEEEIHQLDVEIKGLRDTLQALLLRRTALAHHAESERSLFAPIRKLPFEVLSHVFNIRVKEHIHDVEIRSTKGILPTYDEPIRVIEQTCAYWRSVAHSTPALWTYIDIRFRTHNGMAPSVGPVIQKYIKLSGDKPLTIKFDSIPYSTMSLSGALGNACLEYLRMSVPRWEIVHGIDTQQIVGIMSTTQIDPTAPSTKPEVVNIQPTPFLKQFSVRELSTPISFRSIPVLTHIELNHINSPTIFDNFPWSRITHFSISKNVIYPTGELIYVFTRMKNLMSLNIGQEIVLLTHITLKKVEILTLEQEDYLRYFTVPNLKSLRLKWNNPYDPVKTRVRESKFFDLLERSRCMIEDLGLASMRMLEDGWRNAHLREIKRICITTSRSLRDDLRILNRLIGGVDVLPHLEVLIIKLDRDPSDAVEEIIPAISSRLSDANNAGDASLKYLKYVTIENVSRFHVHIDKVGSLKSFALTARQMYLTLTLT